MATASLVLKKKVLSDFGKYVFYLNPEQKVHVFSLLCSILHLSKVFFNKSSVSFPEENIMDKTDTLHSLYN